MSKVKPIPPGYHTIVPHLVVRNAKDAIDFYKKAFGAEERARMLMPTGQILHAELQIGDSRLFLAEEMPMGGCKSPQTLSGTATTLHMYVENADAAVDRAVKAGATVTLPLMDAFWGDRYGRLKDPFGHEWSVATHQRDLTPEEMAKAAQDACAKMAAKA
jgi:uncharacterized glyoxalase superfamily protein PhnB